MGFEAEARDRAGVLGEDWSLTSETIEAIRYEFTALARRAYASAMEEAVSEEQAIFDEVLRNDKTLHPWTVERIGKAVLREALRRRAKEIAP